MSKIRKFPDLRPFDLSRLGAPAKQSGAVAPSATATKEADPVYLTEGFWKDLPYRQRIYFVRDHYIAFPAATTRANIVTVNVPNGAVLMVTSIVYRATLLTGVHATDYTFARDTYLGFIGRYFALVNGQTPYDRLFAFPVLNVAFAGTTILNQEQAVPGLPYVLVADSGQQLTIDIQTIAFPAGFVPPDRAGVELRGLWVSKATYDRNRARFEGE